jgi:hypothetical protein
MTISAVLAIIVGFPVFSALYFFPTIGAYFKGYPSLRAFFLANLFFGWTFLGWIILLGVAATTKPVVTPIAQGTWKPNWKDSSVSKKATPKKAQSLKLGQ